MGSIERCFHNLDGGGDMLEQGVMKQGKVIVFGIGNEEYAVRDDQVGSMERVESITRYARTERFVKGIINLGGIVMPVIDLRLRFGIDETSYTETTRIIIIHVDQVEVGLIVDVANDVLDIQEDMIESAPEVVGTIHVDYILGVAKYDKRLLILLDLQKVLATEEIEQLQGAEG